MGSGVVRTNNGLQAEFADNSVGAITAQDGRDLIASSFGFSYNRAPGVADDSANTSGVGAYFDVGSKWLNTVTGAWYKCRSGTPGAAVWQRFLLYGDTAGGRLQGTYPNPSLADSGVQAGVYGGPGVTVGLVINADGTISLADSFIISSGTVTSVGLVMPVDVFGVSGSPVTTSGTLTVTKKTQLHGLFFASDPTIDGLAPTFRGLTSTDVTAVGAPVWALIDVDWTDFNALGPGNRTLNFSVPANTHIHCMLLRHTQVWTDAPATPLASMNVGFSGGAAAPPGVGGGVNDYYGGNLPQVNADNTARMVFSDYEDTVSGNQACNPNPAGWTITVQAVHDVASLWLSGHTRIAFLYSHPPF
jgi:hypothetical protein